jgi:hypothetical protein
MFRRLGVRDIGFNLPRQHSMVHYRSLIEEFGAPNGLCSSITESKHITAVKQPWRRSNKNQPMAQMLINLERLDCLECARRRFALEGLLSTSFLLDAMRGAGLLDDDDAAPPEDGPREQDGLIPENEGDDGGAVEVGHVEAEVHLARTTGAYSINEFLPTILTKQTVRGLSRDVDELATALDVPALPELVDEFLLSQEPDTASDSSSASAPLPADPVASISVYNSAVATFYAPSDPSGTRGMRRERMRAIPTWRRGKGRYDTIFIANGDGKGSGMQSLLVARARRFFSLRTRGGRTIPCALVHWWTVQGDACDEDTGMWIAEPDFDEDGQAVLGLVHLDCLVRAAHLIPVYLGCELPHGHSFADTLDAFESYYVNKFATKTFNVFSHDVHVLHLATA